MKDNSKFKIQNSKLIFFEFLEVSSLNSLNSLIPLNKSATGVTLITPVVLLHYYALLLLNQLLQLFDLAFEYLVGIHHIAYGLA